MKNKLKTFLLFACIVAITSTVAVAQGQVVEGPEFSSVALTAILAAAIGGAAGFKIGQSKKKK